MALIRGVVFDLDDTLYLEREYVRSGFLYVATMLHGVEGLSGDQIFAYLWELFERGVRGDTFNLLLEVYPQMAQRVQVEDLVRAYRAHVPRIKPFPYMIELIRYLQSKFFRMGLLSDGPLESQQAKAKALGLGTFFEPVILTDIWGQGFWKPHPKGYEYIAEVWKLQPQELVYIGDNPNKDFVTPKQLGWFTVRLRIRNQLTFGQEPPSSEYAPDVEVSSLKAIEAVLESLRGSP